MAAHRIQPARLKPGAAVDDAAAARREAGSGGPAHLIRGKALIFWDPKSATPKKLDAIDTD